MSAEHPLEPRARQLLRTLIAQYLEAGQPVGSRTLSRSAGLDVSPATIRNIMADLEELGLIASPHTSAGRVPTARGLRLFVDSLLELKPLPRDLMLQMRRELPHESVTPRELLGNASALLSAMTHFVGLVTVPAMADAPLKQMEFVSLDARRVLAILVFADGQVQNRVLNPRQRFDARALEQAANYLNEHYAGLRIDEIRLRVLAELRAAGSELNRLLDTAVEVAAETFAPEPQS
ncbi:MAG: heat-inducible transcriptional repressor HrcA, partial [Rhodanobacteraceae bacterium]